MVIGYLVSAQRWLAAKLTPASCEHKRWSQTLVANTGRKHWQTLQAKIRAQPLGDGLFLATYAIKTYYKLYVRPVLPA